MPESQTCFLRASIDFPQRFLVVILLKISSMFCSGYSPASLLGWLSLFFKTPRGASHRFPSRLLLCWRNRNFNGRGTWHQLYDVLHLCSSPQSILFKREMGFPDQFQLLLLCIHLLCFGSVTLCGSSIPERVSLLAIGAMGCQRVCQSKSVAKRTYFGGNTLLKVVSRLFDSSNISLFFRRRPHWYNHVVLHYRNSIRPLCHEPA